VRDRAEKQWGMTDWTWASPFITQKAAAGSRGAHLGRKHEISPIRQKIIGKNVEEMFAYRKVAEENDLCGLAVQYSQAACRRGFIFSTD
jgi:hypothetical protein